MNERQVQMQLKYKLLQRKWMDDDANGVVFGDGAIVAGRISEDAFLNLSLPAFIIVPMSGRADPEMRDEPGLIEQMVGLRIYNHHENDEMGEALVIGGNLTDGDGESEGRGLLEYQEETFEVVNDMSDKDGVRIRLNAHSLADSAFDGTRVRVGWRDYQFRAWVSSAKFFHPCSNLEATDQGNGGDVVLTWDVPPDRFDRYRVVLRRADGSTPPSSITDGDDVPLGSELPTGVTDPIGSTGTFSYALFGTYDDVNARPEGTPENDDYVSASITRTVTVT